MYIVGKIQNRIINVTKKLINERLENDEAKTSNDITNKLEDVVKI